MLHPSTRKLVDKLLEMTFASKISWKEGDDGGCFYDTEGYRVTIGQAPSRLVLLDAGGRVLETASDVLLLGTVDDDGTNYAAKVEQMVAEARRQFTGSLEAIDRIVSALDLDGDGMPDAEESAEQVQPQEDDAPEEEAPKRAFPGEQEMASRVAALAERVNGAWPPASEAPVEAEPSVEEPEMAAEKDAAPAEKEPVTEAEVSEGFEAEPVQEDKPDGDAVTGLEMGMAAASGDEDCSELASKSGMEEPEDEADSVGWTVPESASELATEAQEFDAPEAEPIMSFSPAEATEPEILASAPAGAEAIVEEKVEEMMPEVAQAESFGEIGPFGAASDAVGALPAVDGDPAFLDEEAEEAEADSAIAEEEAVEIVSAEAIVYPAPPWGAASPAIDAVSVTPSELTTPVETAVDEAEYLPMEVEPVEAEPVVSEQGAFVSRFAEPSVEPVEASFVDEAEYVAVEVEEVVAEPEPVEPKEEPETYGRKTIFKYNPWM